MRIAAGIIMLAFGIFVFAAGVVDLLGAGYGTSVQTQLLLPLAVSVLILVAGIGALRKRAYWWVLLAAIAMVIVGTTNAVRIWQQSLISHGLGTTTRVLMSAGSSAIWAVPGLVALIFLVKRKGEFLTSPGA